MTEDYMKNTLDVLIQAFEECNKTDREGYYIAKELLEKRNSRNEVKNEYTN